MSEKPPENPNTLAAPEVSSDAQAEDTADVVELHPESEAFAVEPGWQRSVGAWETGRNAQDVNPEVVRNGLMGDIGRSHAGVSTVGDRQFVAGLYQLLGDEMLSLPQFPETPLKLDQLLKEEEPNSAQAMRVIEGDPSLVGRVWRAAKSARFPSAPSTLDNAVSRIGLVEVWRMSFETAVDAINVKPGPFREVAEEVRAHGALVADVTAGLARVRRGPQFLAGLLHDVGWLIILQVASETNPEMETVQRMLDQHHADIGVLVAHAWRMGRTVIEGIAYHHDPNAIEAGSKDLCRLVKLADIAVDGELDRQAKRDSGFQEALRQTALRPAMANKALTLAAHAIKRREGEMGESS